MDIPWPEHKAAMHLSHNDHLNNYQTVEQMLADDHFVRPEDFVSSDELVKAIAANELWTLQWYPETPVGFCVKHAASFEALFDA